MAIEQQLAQNLTAESKAYGYTLAIWGGGSILGAVYGTPTLVQTFLYVVGALIAFGIVVIFTFDDLFVDDSLGSQIPVPSMIHLLATLGTLVVGFLLAQAVKLVAHSPLIGFILVGFQVTLLYNLLLPVETGLIRRVSQPQHESAK